MAGVGAGSLREQRAPGGAAAHRHALQWKSPQRFQTGIWPVAEPAATCPAGSGVASPDCRSRVACLWIGPRSALRLGVGLFTLSVTHYPALGPLERPCPGRPRHGNRRWTLRRCTRAVVRGFLSDAVAVVAAWHRQYAARYRIICRQLYSYIGDARLLFDCLPGIACPSEFVAAACIGTVDRRLICDGVFSSILDGLI